MKMTLLKFTSSRLRLFNKNVSFHSGDVFCPFHYDIFSHTLPLHYYQSNKQTSLCFRSRIVMSFIFDFLMRIEAL